MFNVWDGGNTEGGVVLVGTDPDSPHCYDCQAQGVDMLCKGHVEVSQLRVIWHINDCPERLSLSVTYKRDRQLMQNCDKYDC